MSRDFWIERWQKGDIGFHQAEVHDFLPVHWPLLDVPRGSAVFVPLCGKSLDMVWLAENGYRVVGAELSPLAVDDFFREQEIETHTRVAGPFVVRSGGPYTIWCGDVFDLPAEAVRDVAGVYDRAALVALPSTLQFRYAEKLAHLLPGPVPILLASLAYPEAEISGPPFSTPMDQIVALFGGAYDIHVVESRDGLANSLNLKARGVSALEETAYRLTRKAA